jgi:hypothetical protein
MKDDRTLCLDGFEPPIIKVSARHFSRSRQHMLVHSEFSDTYQDVKNKAMKFLESASLSKEFRMNLVNH